MKVVKVNENETIIQSEKNSLQADGTYAPIEVNIKHDKSAKDFSETLKKIQYILAIECVNSKDCTFIYNAIKTLEQENQQLSEKLGKYIEQKDEWIELLQKYKEVIENVIKEIYKLRHQIICGKCIYNGTTNLDNLLQILYKVKDVK